MINLLVYNFFTVFLPNLLRQAQEPPPRRGAIIRVSYKDMSTMRKDPVTVKDNKTENIM